MPQHIGQYSQIERLPGYTVDQDLTDLHSINARESLGVESIRNVEKFVNVSNVRPLTVLSDGKLYGANDTEDIYVSDDDGDSWTLVSNGLSGTIRCIRQLGDGEVLVSTSSALQKSSGWPNSPTWSSVLSVTNGIFLEWGVKTYPGSNKCAASEYDGDYLGSKVWISDDDGDTWTEVFSVAAGYHIHGVERDQWANWRIFVCYHRGPGSDPNKPNNDENGTWYSDNGGTTWNRVPFQSEYTIDADEGGTSHPDPTTIDALERGVVFGSDHPPNGIWILPRVPNTNPEWYIRPVLIHRDKSVSLSGVARKGVLGSDGILYVGFNSISPQEGYLDATDGVGAWTVYTTEEGGPSPNPAGVTSSGKLILRVGSDTVRTDEPKRSVPTIDQLGNNAGGIFGGINAEAGKGSINTAVAIGQARATGDSSSEFAGGSVAVGFGANAPGTNGVSVGPNQPLVSAAYQSEAAQKAAAMAMPPAGTPTRSQLVPLVRTRRVKTPIQVATREARQSEMQPVYVSPMAQPLVMGRRQTSMARLLVTPLTLSVTVLRMDHRLTAPGGFPSVLVPRPIALMKTLLS
jgi:hypothetical protein